jgi:hypothetical protein
VLGALGHLPATISHLDCFGQMHSPSTSSSRACSRPAMLLMAAHVLTCPLGVATVSHGTNASRGSSWLPGTACQVQLQLPSRLLLVSTSSSDSAGCHRSTGWVCHIKHAVCSIRHTMAGPAVTEVPTGCTECCGAVAQLLRFTEVWQLQPTSAPIEAGHGST